MQMDDRPELAGIRGYLSYQYMDNVNPHAD